MIAVPKSSQRRCCIKKDVLKNFAIFTESHLSWSLYLMKLQVFRLFNFIKKRQVFSCEYSKIIKKTYFEKQRQMAAFVYFFCFICVLLMFHTELLLHVQLSLLHNDNNRGVHLHKMQFYLHYNVKILKRY